MGFAHRPSASVCVLVSALTTVVAAETGKRPENELPVPIPSAPVRSRELVEEVRRLAAEIQDPDERFRTLSRALYKLEPFPPEQRGPVVDALRATAKNAKGQTLISSRESLVLYAPELGLELARRIDDQRLRSIYISEVIPRIAHDRPKLFEQLLDEVTLPECRAEAILGYARLAEISYDRLAPLLTEAAALEWPEHRAGSRAYHFKDALAPFAAGKPEEVIQFLSEQLQPEEAITVLSGVAWQLSRRSHAPEAARKFVEHATSLVPRTKAPARSALTVIHSGYHRLEPRAAADLFDRFVLPAIARREMDPEYPLSLLGNIGMDLLSSRAEAVAEARNTPLIRVLPKAVGRAAHECDPDRVLAWLKSQAPSALRTASTAEVAATLRFRVPDRDFGTERVRNWIEILVNLAGEIEDDQTRWRILTALLTISDNAGIAADDIRKEWQDLWGIVRAGPELKRDEASIYRSHFHWLSPADQRARIARSLNSEPGDADYWKREEHPPWTTVRLIDQSSLSTEEKMEGYRQIAEQADPMALAAVASRASLYDYPWALKEMWDILPTARNPRMPYPDTSPPVEAPENATTALQWLRGGVERYMRRGAAGEIIAALWSHAQSVSQADREAVLAELVDVLLADGQLENALGVARQINDPGTRLLLLAEIAGRDAPVAAEVPDLSDE